MLPKKKRTWLFRKSRPLVRQFEAKDRGFMWAAYLGDAFGLSPGMTQEQFTVEMAKMFGSFPLVWIIEDDSNQFRSGRGPVSMVGINTDGWSYRPTSMFFPWARKRHILRSCVAFLQMIRYQKDVGCCVIQAPKEQTGVLNHMAKYGVLYLRGRIPNGSKDGDLFLYSITGKKSATNAVPERMAA